MKGIRSKTYINKKLVEKGDNIMELKGIKMACLGDSITEGVGVTDLSNMYYNRIQRECGIRELYIDGIGGTRIACQKNPSEDPRQA